MSASVAGRVTLPSETGRSAILTRPVSVSLNSVRLDCEAQAFVSCQVVALPDGFQEYSRFEPPSFHGSR